MTSPILTTQHQITVKNKLKYKNQTSTMGLKLKPTKTTPKTVEPIQTNSLQESQMGASAAKPDTTALSKSIPIHRTDLSIFDDNYSSMRERFVAEMRRVEDEMNKFSSSLIKLYVQTGGKVTGKADKLTWDSIVSSPLVTGEGQSRSLKLQFDVSQFDPAEVNVRILDNVLMVSASHKEKTDTNSVIREMKREFLLPKGTTPDQVKSLLSRDGVLTIEAPLPNVAVEEARTPSKESTDSAPNNVKALKK